MQVHQDKLIAAIAPKQSYIALQQLMHQQLADILVDTNILQCSAAEAFETTLLKLFVPTVWGISWGFRYMMLAGSKSAPLGSSCHRQRIIPVCDLLGPSPKTWS